MKKAAPGFRNRFLHIIVSSGLLQVRETGKPIPHIAESFSCCALEFLPVIRMGDGNQSLGTLDEVLVSQIDTAVFSNDVLGLETGSYHTGTSLSLQAER